SEQLYGMLSFLQSALWNLTIFTNSMLARTEPLTGIRGALILGNPHAKHATLLSIRTPLRPLEHLRYEPIRCHFRRLLCEHESRHGNGAAPSTRHRAALFRANPEKIPLNA